MGILSHLTMVIVAASALLPAGSGQPSTTTATSFVVTNAASFESDLDGKVAAPRGALLALFTVGGTVTDEADTFTPWRTATPSGLTVQASCTARDALLPLPILAVTPSQINVYYPNEIGEEPWGACDYPGPIRIRVRATDGQIIERSINMVAAHPGGFFVDAGGTPAGNHQNGPRLLDCWINPAACPVSIDGTAAKITLYATGAEAFTCPGCQADLHILLNGLAQTTISVQTAGTGLELVTVQLTNVPGDGTYQLTLESTAPQPSTQVMQVRLGAPV